MDTGSEPQGSSATADAERVQENLAVRVHIPNGPVDLPRTVVGLDVSYATGSAQITAAAVVMSIETGRVLEEIVVEGEAEFPYVPGLLAFREVPILLEALSRLHAATDLLLCDGQGLAHPRRCGLACHLGVLTGSAAVGCAKTHLVGDHRQPGPLRGDRAPLLLDGQVVGHAVRTRDGVRPVYVSPGHRIGPDQATELVLSLCRGFRAPEPLRRADHISRAALPARLAGRKVTG